MMSDLVLPCGVCAPVYAVVVDVVESVVRCRGCGSERPLVRRPLYLVSGAPGTGKSVLVEGLAGRVAGVPVFDSDLFGGVAHSEWGDWATSWLLVAYGLARCGMSVVLCGYGLHRSGIEELPARLLVGDVSVLNLDLSDSVLRDRLRRRAGYDDARVERKVAMARTLRREADVNVDVSLLSRAEVVVAVESWLRQVVG